VGGPTVSFRRKLLAVFTVTVFVAVVLVSLIVAAIARRTFERADEERSAALLGQFRREFQRRGDEVSRRVANIAASGVIQRMALSMNPAIPDYASYLNEAQSVAQSQQLDFLEFLDNQGTIISSAQWPAKFGYKEPKTIEPFSSQSFLKREDLPEGAALGLFAIRPSPIFEKSLYVLGGVRLDREFLSSLELPAGMRALLYQNLAPAFSSQWLIGPGGRVPQGEKFADLIERVQQQRQEISETIHWSGSTADDETFQAIPLKGQAGQLLGVLLVGSSRRPFAELERRIGSAALLVGGVGIVVAILLSGWAASRVTRPVEQLAAAAREVAGGNFKTQVEVTSSDELGELADAFNRMTRDLLEQKERLVQTERVAAWRELARRLAHELKNPLFPLQLTVENLLRARQQSPEQFEEIFRESSETLLAEIANLKTIISRFSEFAKMPQPQLQRVQVNEVMQGVARLFQAQFQSHEKGDIACRLELDEKLPAIAADPELLHRAISNLVLNAMDAMPEGGTLLLCTWREGESVLAEVSDTGAGLTREECERLFTPYYTSKQHGTGLGLAIVQSVISDHQGKISVESQPGKGTKFRIRLPIGTPPAASASAQRSTS
jgi:signal transduction histidine kinase